MITSIVNETITLPLRSFISSLSGEEKLLLARELLRDKDILKSLVNDILTSTRSDLMEARIQLLENQPEINKKLVRCLLQSLENMNKRRIMANNRAAKLHYEWPKGVKEPPIQEYAPLDIEDADAEKVIYEFLRLKEQDNFDRKPGWYLK